METVVRRECRHKRRCGRTDHCSVSLGRRMNIVFGKLTACRRPCVVGGATCSGVYTSSESWRTYSMTRSVSGGEHGRARFTAGKNTSGLSSSECSFLSLQFKTVDIKQLVNKTYWTLLLTKLSDLAQGCKTVVPNTK